MTQLNLKQTCTIGADPEFFVSKAGAPHSAHGLAPGDKKNPFLVPYGALQVDGMALEFNILPAMDPYTFKHNIRQVINSMRHKVSKEYEFVFEPVAIFEKAHFEAQPDEAKELGCDPDFNAWDEGKENPRPDNTTTMRTASGHIHVGFSEELLFDDKHLETCHDIVKEMDIYLGIPSVLFDKESRRRSMYGKAGAYRPKVYGVEYRVLSNAWLNSAERLDWAFNNTQLAYHACRDGFKLSKVIPRETVEHIINNSDVKAARKFCRDFAIPTVR